MAQPLPSQPPQLAEETDLAVSEAEPPVRLLQDPPERKVTGPRPRPGLRKRPVSDETPLPPRGAGMTITSYLISGLLAYGLIGRAVHLEILTAVGMLIGLGISMALIIYRYGRSTPPRIYRFAPKPVAAHEPNEQNGPTTNDARGTDR